MLIVVCLLVARHEVDPRTGLLVESCIFTCSQGLELLRLGVWKMPLPLPLCLARLDHINIVTTTKPPPPSPGRFRLCLKSRGVAMWAGVP